MFRFPTDHVFVIAEIGINHNGSVEIAEKLIDAAAAAGCNAVKFQKRTPMMVVPPEQWNVERDTPWGRMTTIAYREKIELGHEDYEHLASYAWERGMYMSASPWDIHSANALYTYGMPFIKIASAAVTNIGLLEHIAKNGTPVVMSTGMSTLEEIQKAVGILQAPGKIEQLALLVCTSKYPAPVEDLNLSRINTLKAEFPDCIIGYSGHEVGLWTTLCAVVVGARIVERHITLDRAMKGSDHAASVEPHGMELLVREIRQWEKAKGTPEIRVMESELSEIKRLRGSTLQVTGATRADETWVEANAPWRIRHCGLE